MQATTPELSRLESLFSEKILKHQQPQWLIEIRQKAFALLRKLSPPDKNHESWRRFPMQNFQPIKLLETIAIHPAERLPQSIIPFDQISDSQQQYLVGFLHSQIENYQQDYFFLLTLSFFTGGGFLDIAGDSSPDDILLDWQCTEGCCLPLWIYKIGNGSKVQLQESVSTTHYQPFSLYSSVHLIDVENSSSLEYSQIDNFSDSTFALRRVYLQQDQDSQLNYFYFYRSGYRSKVFVDAHLAGEGASFRGYGIACPQKREYQDLEMTVAHQKSHTQSDLHYRTVMKDKAHHVFTGNLIIPAHCRQVTAHQLNQNLMLAKTARAQSIPKLEVMAEDVQCAHGATVGEMDIDELFYLYSRGLNDEQAKKLLLEGFLNAILDHLMNEKRREEIKKSFFKRLQLGEES